MKSTIQLSPIVAGCMKWGQWGSRFTTAAYCGIIESCIENKITSFDHADIYGDYTTEEEFGKALNQLPSLRSSIQLITKCGIKMPVANRPTFNIKSYDTSKEYIISCVERSLKNLQTDYIDIFLIHRPDPLMNPEEITAAFAQLKQQGKVLHTGVSNFTPSQVNLLHTYYPVEVNQIEISLLHMDPFHNGQLDQCMGKGIVPMAWSPLGGGSLMTDTIDERNKRILKVATALRAKYQTSIENILLAFLHRHPSGIIPVMGTSKIERLQSANSAANIKLEAEEWFMLWEASAGKQVP
jgi:predicted oxidoreductase